MAKQTVPRRIDANLLSRADALGKIFHRSGTEQLEHWAWLGAAVEAAMGIGHVAKLKSAALTGDLDKLIAEAGTPAANARLGSYLAILRQRQEA